MKFIDFKNSLKDFTLFSLADIRNIAPTFYRRRLNEWQKKGYLKKIIKGYYIFTDLEINEYTLFEIANKIYKPSYISFEMALSYYHLIPEGVYTITSATTRRTYIFQNDTAQFNYHTIKKDFFFGYELVNHNGKVFKIAGIEKAILDYFYIHPHLKNESDFAGLRLNSGVLLQKVNKDKLYGMLKKFSRKALTKRIAKLLEFIEND